MKILPILLLLSQAYYLFAQAPAEQPAIQVIQGGEADNPQSQTDSDSKQVIIINNNVESSADNQNSVENSVNVNGNAQGQKKKLGRSIAAYARLGFGSITGETGNDNAFRPFSGIGNFSGIGTTSGSLDFLYITFGLSVTIDIGKVLAPGFYFAGRGILVTEGQFVANNSLQKPSLNSDDDYAVLGLGLDFGPYLRLRLWGKDHGGGIGGAIYVNANLLSSSPDPSTPFPLFGIGVMLDIFITKGFGISGSIEISRALYESAAYDFFDAIGPSFSIGIAVEP